MVNNKYIVNYFFSLNIINEFYKKNKMKIVISGGPGTGKTSIINELLSIGQIVFHESSREITTKYKKLGYDQLFLSDPIKFSKILLSNRVKQYKDANKFSSKNCFFDRGIPDVIAYLDYKKVAYNKAFTINSQKYKYDMIFIVEPWNEIYKKDQERYESFNQLIDIDYFIKETYRGLGYEHNIIPNGTIQERVDYILNEIQ